MNCPKCMSPMAQVVFAGVEVDRCTNCQGIFFDELEKERLQKMKGADAIDTGDVRAGRAQNDKAYVNCPRCGSRMVRKSDLKQPHICFEQCTACHGSFFDAGEFKDLKHHTIVDFFRDFAARRPK